MLILDEHSRRHLEAFTSELFIYVCVEKKIVSQGRKVIQVLNDMKVIKL